jgi:hypothetical protein
MQSNKVALWIDGILDRSEEVLKLYLVFQTTKQSREARWERLGT